MPARPPFPLRGPGRGPGAPAPQRPLAGAGRPRRPRPAHRDRAAGPRAGPRVHRGHGRRVRRRGAAGRGRVPVPRHGHPRGGGRLRHRAIQHRSRDGAGPRLREDRPRAPRRGGGLLEGAPPPALRRERAARGRHGGDRGRHRGGKRRASRHRGGRGPRPGVLLRHSPAGPAGGPDGHRADLPAEAAVQLQREAAGATAAGARPPSAWTACWRARRRWARRTDSPPARYPHPRPLSQGRGEPLT